MNPIWYAAIPSVFALVAVRIFLAGSRTLASSFEESGSQVIIRRRRITVYLSAILIVAPWPLIAKVISADDASPAVIFFGTSLFTSASGAAVALLAHCLRKVVISHAGVRVEGYHSAEFGWHELRDMEATVNGSIGSVRFVFPEKSIAVDSTFDGFRALVRALEVWPTGNAKELGQKAARALAQWREDPKSSK
jgi:hypothetical protein